MASCAHMQLSPQPGDGTFSPLANSYGLHGPPHRRWRRKPKQTLALAPGDYSTVGVATDVANDVHSSLAPITERLDSPSPSAPEAAAQAASATPKPRTVGDTSLLSAWTAESSIEKPQSQSPAFLSHSQGAQMSPQQHYTTNKSQDARSMATTAMTKPQVLPPHLKPKTVLLRKDSQPSVPMEATEKILSTGVNVSAVRPADRSGPSSWAKSKPEVQAPLTSSVQTYSCHESNRGHARGRGRGRGAAAANRRRRSKTRKGGWLVKSDFPAPDPKRWETNWNDSRNSVQSSIPSEWADNCWIKQEMVPGDEHLTGFQLCGYDGKFAPAPLEWDSRPAFREGQSEAAIWKWLCQIYPGSETSGERRIVATHPIHNEKNDTVYSFATYDCPTEGVTIKLMGDLAPSCWIPTAFGHETTQQFWLNHLRTRCPEPVDPEDLRDVKPWWELVFKGRNFLKQCSQPPCIGIDPMLESNDQKMQREYDTGSWNAARDRKNYETAKAQKKQSRLVKKAEKAQQVKAKSQQLSLPIMLAANIYIAIAQEEDVQEVAYIYNHYVENSCVTTESDHVTTSEILKRFRESRIANLPFLVAVERGELTKASCKVRRSTKNAVRASEANAAQKRNPRRPAEDIQLSDKIIGFARAYNYGDMKSMFRYSATVEVFVKSTHLMKGIASSLLDQMIVMLDPEYPERGGYDAESDLEGIAPQRAIKNIIVNFYYESQKPERLEWMSRWLGERFDFQRLLVDEDLGVKLGKAISVAKFRRVTGLVLDYANPPPVLCQSL